MTSSVTTAALRTPCQTKQIATISTVTVVALAALIVGAAIHGQYPLGGGALFGAGGTLLLLDAAYVISLACQKKETEPKEELKIGQKKEPQVLERELTDDDWRQFLEQTSAKGRPFLHSVFQELMETLQPEQYKEIVIPSQGDDQNTYWAIGMTQSGNWKTVYFGNDKHWRLTVTIDPSSVNYKDVTDTLSQ